ncbi:MAG TPA: hypothetical protein VFQ12_08785, partial [Thermoleophilaceae bacterium]|nr:hypothetical protein [Thermoleophilaceae bacterium]
MPLEPPGPCPLLPGLSGGEAAGLSWLGLPPDCGGADFAGFSVFGPPPELGPPPLCELFPSPEDPGADSDRPGSFGLPVCSSKPPVVWP